MLREQFHKTIDKSKAFWCEFFHDEPMWPIKGRYQCRKCQRYSEVFWDAPASGHTAQSSPHAEVSLYVVHATQSAAQGPRA